MIQEFRQVMVLSPKRSAVLSKRKMYAEFKSASQNVKLPSQNQPQSGVPSNKCSIVFTNVIL